jgi:two-component system, OmpR family, response regulator CpxR
MDRVLLVDDDTEIIAVVTDYLGLEGFEVESVADKEQAIMRSISGKYVLVVLDVSLPGLNGFDVLRRIRAGSSIPVLIATAYSGDSDRILGLEIGADDYLPKPFNPRELVARARAILRRTLPVATPSSQDRLSVGDIELDKAAWVVRRAHELIELTAIEFQLLEALLRAPGRVLTRQELVEKVLGRHFSPFDRSIDMHTCKLRRKLGKSIDGKDRIKTIRGVGYSYVNPSEVKSQASTRSGSTCMAWNGGTRV